MNLKQLMAEYYDNLQMLEERAKEDKVYLENGYVVHFVRYGYWHHKMTLAEFMKSLKQQREKVKELTEVRY